MLESTGVVRVTVLGSVDTRGEEVGMDGLLEGKVVVTGGSSGT